MYNRFIIILILVFLDISFGYGQGNETGIRLIRTGNHPQLIISGTPFFIRGGELGNSSASSMNYMDSRWPQLQQMNLNTVLAPVYWEMMEPREGFFDFSLTDSLISKARMHGFKLILLWFGTWKNSMSCYTPEWMKTNPDRFPRTSDSNHRSQELFSVFGKNTLQADKKAFSALMRHIRETDAVQKTVIMIQVENEIGMLTTAREFSAAANSIYEKPIPAALMQYLQAHKEQLIPELKEKWAAMGYPEQASWEKMFGKSLSTEEIFQAWYYAKFANEIAAAGKQEYDLPMFVNAALPRPGRPPGVYPSAGPLPHLMDIWQAGAPSLDMLSPDFYNPDIKFWGDLYVRNNNILFIPEIRFDKTCGAKALFVAGHYKSVGFSPFSIDEENEGAENLTQSYSILRQLQPFMVPGQYLSMDGFLFDKQNQQGNGRFGDYNVTLKHENTTGWSADSKEADWKTTAGILIQTGPDEFLVGGTGIVVVFYHKDTNLVTNILRADEVSFNEGEERKGRRMNGDQDHQGRHIRIATGEWGIQKVRLYNSPALVR